MSMYFICYNIFSKYISNNKTDIGFDLVAGVAGSKRACPAPPPFQQGHMPIHCDEGTFF